MRNSTIVLLGVLALLLVNPWAPAVRADRKDNKDALKATMRRWSKELGVKCGHCHVSQGRKFDYEAATHLKAVALVCADEFVLKLQGEGARPLSCATCHVDKAHTFLPRPEGEAETETETREAVAAFCQENFVAKLTVKEGREAVTCATCHGDEGEPRRFFPREDDPGKGK